ncbi:hypothetical protein M514_08836, partial [Trichuris suis]
MPQLVQRAAELSQKETFPSADLYVRREVDAVQLQEKNALGRSKEGDYIHTKSQGPWKENAVLSMVVSPCSTVNCCTQVRQSLRMSTARNLGNYHKSMFL